MAEGEERLDRRDFGKNVTLKYYVPESIPDIATSFHGKCSLSNNQDSQPKHYTFHRFQIRDEAEKFVDFLENTKNEFVVQPHFLHHHETDSLAKVDSTSTPVREWNWDDDIWLYDCESKKTKCIGLKTFVKDVFRQISAALYSFHVEEKIYHGNVRRSVCLNDNGQIQLINMKQHPQGELQGTYNDLAEFKYLVEEIIGSRMPVDGLPRPQAYDLFLKLYNAQPNTLTDLRKWEFFILRNCLFWDATDGVNFAYHSWSLRARNRKHFDTVLGAHKLMVKHLQDWKKHVPRHGKIKLHDVMKYSDENLLDNCDSGASAFIQFMVNAHIRTKDDKHKPVRTEQIHNELCLHFSDHISYVFYAMVSVFFRRSADLFWIPLVDYFKSQATFEWSYHAA